MKSANIGDATAVCVALSAVCSFLQPGQALVVTFDGKKYAVGFLDGEGQIYDGVSQSIEDGRLINIREYL